MNLIHQVLDTLCGLRSFNLQLNKQCFKNTFKFQDLWTPFAELHTYMTRASRPSRGRVSSVLSWDAQWSSDVTFEMESGLEELPTHNSLL